MDTASLSIVTVRGILKTARCAEDVFGESDAARTRYRALAAVTHPDRYRADAANQDAAEVFKRVNEWWREAQRKLDAGTYGDRARAHEVTPAPPFEPIVIKAQGQTYTVTSRLDHRSEADLCDLYVAGDQVLKAARSPQDNDLLEAESTVLAAIHRHKLYENSTVLSKCLPRVTRSFVLRDRGAARRVNVLPKYEGFVSLHEVLQVYPEGIDFRDAAWMLRRVLEGIDYAHAAGYAHTALWPSNILINPATHQGMIIDWCYAVKLGTPARAIVSRYRDHYPDEVLAKQALVPTVDVAIWASLARLLVGKQDVPGRLTKFWDGIRFVSPTLRPAAWDCYREFGSVLETLVGKPKFRPFSLERT